VGRTSWPAFFRRRNVIESHILNEPLLAAEGAAG